MSPAFRARINAICADLPGVEVSDPWGSGHDAWKVGEKMFACMGSVSPGVSVKCPDVETADLLREQGVAGKAPYFHASWVHLDETSPEEELAPRIAQSYAIVRKGLTKKLQSSLPPFNPDDHAMRKEG